MARTVEAILKANTSQFDSAVTGSAAKLNQLADAAARAGAKVDASISKSAASFSKLGAASQASATQTAAGLGRVSTASQNIGKAGAGIKANEAHLSALSRTAGVVGLALAGVGVAAVKSSADFDAAMSGVKSTGADAAGRIGELRKAALDAGAATKFSATEAANAQEELAKAGVSAADSLGGGLRGALDLAAAGSLGVADAASIAATAMSQFGLAGADVPHIADLLAAGAGKAQGSVQDLGLALNYVGPVAAGMGISIEQTTGALAEFANAGIVGEQGGTALRGVLLSLTSPSKLAADAMHKYGITLYDAQGNFVGINGAAESLKQGLGGLNNATRDAALGQIFGNAQITAARVLYEGGGAAVNKWTGLVNDAGFAARTAATKMDNLKGDVEQLGGALETAFIGAGSGAQGGLRGITQTAGDAVNAFNKLSPATQSASLGVVAIGAAGLLAVAGVSKLAVGINSSKTAMRELATESPGLSRGLGAIGKAAGVATVALIALEVAGAAAKAFHGVLTPNLEEATKALSSLQKTGNATDLNAMFQIKDVGSFGQATTSIDGLQSAFQRLGSANWGDNLNQQIDTMLGTTETDLTKLTVKFQGLDQSLIGLTSAGHGDQAAAQFAAIAAQAQAAGFPVEELTKLFPQYAASVQSVASSAGVANLAGQELADAMSGKLSPALQAALTKNSALASSFGNTAANAANFGTALTVLNTPLQLTAEQSGQLAQSLFAEGNAFQQTVGAHSAYAASLDTADAALGKHSLSIDKNTGYLKDNTDKQRAAADAVGQIATAGKAYVQSLVAQGAGAKEAAAATQTVRDQFVKAADDAGLSTKAANKLADSYGLIPDNVTTEFQTFGLALQDAQVKAYGERIRNLPKEQQAHILAVYNDKGAKAALRELGILEKKNAKPKVTLDPSKAIKAAADTSAALNKTGRIKVSPSIRPPSTAAKKVADDTSNSLDKTGRKHPNPKITPPSGKAKAVADDASNSLDRVGRKHPTPKISVTSNAAGVASSAQRSINSVHGKSVSITIHRNTVTSSSSAQGTHAGGRGSTSATGGQITPYGVLYREAGGSVPGWSPNDKADNIPAMLTAREFVQPVAAVDFYGVEAMRAIQKMRVPRDVFANFSGGGSVDAGNHLASGGQPQGMWYGEKAYGTVLRDILGIDKRLVALSNPLYAVAKASQAVARAQTIANTENRRIAAPRATLTTATNRLTAAQARKAADQADQLELRKHVDALKKRADATKGVTAADKAYRKAQSQLTAQTRKISGETLNITKLTKAHTTAQAAYNKVSEKAKAAADALKTAQDALATQQQALADSARQIATTLVATADSTSTDPLDVLAKRKETTASLTAFNNQLLALRKAGLNDQDIADIVSRGALDGAELAAAILKGGKGLVDALNTAEAALQRSADKVGLTTATGVVRRAGGGWIPDTGGGVDSVRTLTTPREFVVEPIAAQANARLLEAINGSRGRSLIRGMQIYGGQGSSNVTNSRSIAVPVTIGQMGVNEQQVIGKFQSKVMDALVMTGLAGAA